jgi:hypothetical protein
MERRRGGAGLGGWYMKAELGRRHQGAEEEKNDVMKVVDSK